MSYWAFAFFIGLFGSLHCVAMCGPLVSALPLNSHSSAAAVLQRILYQAGRITTYAILGLFLGWVGERFNLLGWQSGISILTGSFLLLLAFFHFAGKSISYLNRLQNKLVSPIALLMGKILSKSYGGFLAGMLNGLIPCGMVYLALAGAINAGSLTNGATYMIFFGLGTTPLMLAASFASVFFRKKIRFNFSALLPYLTFCMGLWLVLRGVQLGIPYISPAINGAVNALCK